MVRRKRMGWSCAVCALMAVPAVVQATEVWQTRGGFTAVRFNEHFLDDLGMLIVNVQETTTAPVWFADEMVFAIHPESTLVFEVEQGRTVRLMKGQVVHRGGFTIKVGDKEFPIRDFVVRYDPKYSEDGLYLYQPCEGCLIYLDVHVTHQTFERETNSLRLPYGDLRIAPALAEALGEPALAGQVIGELSIQAVSEMIDGTPWAQPPRDQITSGVLDLALWTIGSISQVGHQGSFPNGIAAFSMSTTSCNFGTVDIPWFAPMDPRHPFIMQNLYRLMDGRLEQIGRADAKHGFLSTNSSGCGSCDNPGTGTLLGPRCSDTYGVGNNSSHTWLAPLDEINPFTGEWDPCGSHFDGVPEDCQRSHGSSGHTSIDHRLQVDDADLNIDNARFFYEAYYITQCCEVDVLNNIGWREVDPNWTGSTWNMSPLTPFSREPLITTYGDMHDIVDSGEGIVILAVNVDDLGGGMWRYNYALYNHNLDRQIRSLSVPIGGAMVSNVGFHDVDYPRPGDPTNDWTVSIAGGRITWETETFDQNPDANSLKFSRTFTFWFDADRAPVDSEATMDMFKPSGLTQQNSLTAATLAPAPAGIPGDFDGDGDVDIADFSFFTSCFTGSGIPCTGECCAADLDGDGDVDIADFAIFATNFTGSM